MKIIKNVFKIFREREREPLGNLEVPRSEVVEGV
jgi:hypothetical protein